LKRESGPLTGKVEGQSEGKIMHRKVVCVNCGITIRWEPTVVAGKTYCCLGCAQGGPCTCDYDNLPQLGVRNPLVLRPVEFPGGSRWPGPSH